MDFLSGLNPWIYALVIFLLRVCDMSMDTIRVLFVVRGKKLFVFMLGFLQAVIFVVAISSVLTKMGNVLNVLAYALGFATGNVVGMLIENRLAIGHTLVTSSAPPAVPTSLNAFAPADMPSLKSLDAERTARYSNCTPRSPAGMWIWWRPSSLRQILTPLSQPKISARSGADSSGHKSTYKDKGTEMIPVPFLLDGQSSYSLSRSGGKRITSRIE
jgi:hypothetical protein